MEKKHLPSPADRLNPGQQKGVMAKYDDVNEWVAIRSLLGGQSNFIAIDWRDDYLGTLIFADFHDCKDHLSAHLNSLIKHGTVCRLPTGDLFQKITPPTDKEELAAFKNLFVSKQVASSSFDVSNIQTFKSTKEAHEDASVPDGTICQLKTGSLFIKKGKTK